MPVADFLHNRGSDESLLRRRSFARYMCWDAELSNELVEQLWRDPHVLLKAGCKLQDKLRCTVVRLEHAGRPFVWKHHNWGSLRRTVKRSLHQSVASKSWHDARLVETAGIPTPRPRAYVERRLGPLKVCSYILTDFVEGTSLYRIMRYGHPTEQFVRYLARQVADIWQRLDELCVIHNDFKTENLLIDPQGKVWLIDFEKMRRLRRRSQVRRRQVKDARDLLHPRNWRTNPWAAEVFREAIRQTPAGQEAVAGCDGAGHPLSHPVAAANRPTQLVTVLVPCRNAARTIRPCLESVRDMADEILVADASSTDDTRRLVREFGDCRIIEGEGPADAAFEAWANEHAQHPWILRLLPDEQLNPELARKVQDLLATEPREDGFRIGRTFCFGGTRLTHGGFHRETSIRLYRKSAARYETRDGRVEVTIPSGKPGWFKPRLFFHAYSSAEQYLSDAIQVAGRAAEDAYRRGERPRRRGVLWRAPWQFARSYVLGGGWLDGWAGLHASWTSAFAICLREAMLWDMYQPAAMPRSVVNDGRQELQLFDARRLAELNVEAEPSPARAQDDVATSIPLADDRARPAA